MICGENGIVSVPGGVMIVQTNPVQAAAGASLLIDQHDAITGETTGYPSAPVIPAESLLAQVQTKGSER